MTGLPSLLDVGDILATAACKLASSITNQFARSRAYGQHHVCLTFETHVTFSIAPLGPTDAL